MMNLTTTSDVIRIVTAVASEIEVMSAWVDVAGASASLDRLPVRVTAATTAVIVPSPASGESRNVKTINITNAHPSITCAVTVEFFDGTNAIELIRASLVPGQSLIFTEDGLWTHRGLVSSGGLGATWGAIAGTLSDQADLQAALNGKQAAGSYATGAQGALADSALQPGDSIPWVDVAGKPIFATVATTGAYSDLTGIPSTFAPSAHTHPVSAISDSTTAGRAIVTAADAAAQRALLSVETTTQLNTRDTNNRARANHTGTQDWSTITGTPVTFPPSAHGHTDATTGAAGFMSAADKTKLDGVATGAQVNVPTDLAYTAATRLLASSTGADATLPLVTSADAGLAPASGGGTTNFLRADGSWAAPAGGGGGVLNNFTATTAPAATNDGSAGYAVGSRWLWAARGLEWVCVDAAVGAARWVLEISDLAGYYPILRVGAFFGFAPNIFGAANGVVVTGTRSSPAPPTGRMYQDNWATAASTFAQAGIAPNQPLSQVCPLIPSASTGEAYPSRAVVTQFSLPDASYGSGPTGVRVSVHVGATNVNLDLGANPGVWFRYSTEAGDANWQFITRNAGGSTTVVDTGEPVTFGAGEQMQFSVITGIESVTWITRNLSSGTYRRGRVTTTLPLDTHLLESGVRMMTLSATARNFRAGAITIMERAFL